MSSFFLFPHLPHCPLSQQTSQPSILPSYTRLDSSTVLPPQMMSTSQLPSPRVAQYGHQRSAYLASSTSNLLIFVLFQSPLPRPNIVTQQDYKISQSVVEVSFIKSISILEYTRVARILCPWLPRTTLPLPTSCAAPTGSCIARTATSGVVPAKTDRYVNFFPCSRLLANARLQCTIL
jgi:hypothetical protein